MDYQHFLLTWFNLHFPGWGKFKGLDETWLERRFRLFMKFCYPSVKAQTNQNFQWLVFFHQDTPAKYKATIQNLVNDYPNFKPHFVGSCVGNALSGLECIRATTRSLAEKPYLITSRLCNDDSIHRSYIDTVQGLFRYQTLQFINFPVGYYLNAKTGQVCKHRYPSNFFMSLIENTTQSKNTVLNFDHNSVQRKYKILNVEREIPSWLVVVHGGNKSCGMRGKPVDQNFLQVHFPFLSK